MDATVTDQDRLASQRVAGVARLSVEASGGRTRLARLFQEGAAKIRLPRHERPEIEAVLINTAGGMTGGDRLRWEFDIGAGAALTATTQASEKAYRASHGEARVSTAIRVGARGRVAWLPQETILYEGSALDRGLSVELAASAQALLVEPVLLGRKAHGETLSRAFFRENWRVRQDGCLVHADALRLGPDIEAARSSRAMLDGAGAFATVLLIGEGAGQLLDAARDICGPRGGASFWTVGKTGKLLARLVAEDGYALRARLVPLLRLLNHGAALPKLWSS